MFQSLTEGKNYTSSEMVSAKKWRVYLSFFILLLQLKESLFNKESNELLSNKTGDEQLNLSLQWSLSDTSGTTTEDNDTTSKHMDTTLYDTDMDTTLYNTTPKDLDTKAHDTRLKDLDTSSHDRHLDTILNDTELDILHDTNLDTKIHDRDLDILHDTNLDTKLHDKDLDTRLHDRDLDTILNDTDQNRLPDTDLNRLPNTDLDTKIHDKDLDTRLHDTDLDTILHDTDLDTKIHDKDLDTRLHDTDLDTTSRPVNKSSSKCVYGQDWIQVNMIESPDNLDTYCHLDNMCMFYYDCCASKPTFNLRTADALALILTETKSYLQLVQFYEDYRWYQLTTCESWVNVSMVTKCSEEEDIRVKFLDLHNKLNQPSENRSLFLGLSQEDIITRCHKTTTTQDSTLYRIPVTLDTGSTKVDFRNILCAICNGLEPEAVTPWGAGLYCPNCSISFSKQSAMQNLLQYNNTNSSNSSCMMRVTPPTHARKCVFGSSQDTDHEKQTLTPDYGTPVLSFRNLFDLKSYSDVVETCGTNQVFAPFYQMCLDITCPLGRKLIGQSCIMEDVCDNKTCDKNISLVMEAYNMTLPTPSNKIELIFRLKNILTETDDENNEFCFFNKTDKFNSLGTKIQQIVIKKSRKLRSKFYFSLQDLTCIWKVAMLTSRAINETETTLQLMGDLKTVIENTFSDLPIWQVNTSFCPESGWLMLSDDHWSDVCVVITIQLHSSSVTSNMISVAKKHSLTKLNNIANQNNFFLNNVTVTNHVNESKPEGDQICPLDGKLVFTKMPIFTNQNGTFLVDFNITALELEKFIFYIKVNGTSCSKEQPIDQAMVGWCSQPLLKCPYIYVNNLDMTVFQDYLLVTKNVGNINLYLQQYQNRAISLKELQTTLNRQRHSLSAINKGDYILTENGANVCADQFDNKLPKKLIPTTEEERLATVIALTVSVTCLVIVLVVYGLVAELRNVPGKIVMSMSSALLAAQTMFLCCTYPQGLACEIYAALHHAVWLASFAWLAAMSLHLACVLHIKSQRWFNPSKPTIFYLFSILCWGLPSLLAGICLLLHKTGTVAIDYGKNGICWIGNYNMAIAVFVSPMFFLLLVTASCAIFVIKAIRQSSDFRQKNSQHKREKTQLILCVNLSLMMGLTWLFYFLAVAVDTTYMWIVFILTNGSQGLYIFMCYVARNSVIVKLLGQLRKLKPDLHKSTNMTE